MNVYKLLLTALFYNSISYCKEFNKIKLNKNNSNYAHSLRNTLTVF